MSSNTIHAITTCHHYMPSLHAITTYQYYMTLLHAINTCHYYIHAIIYYITQLEQASPAAGDAQIYSNTAASDTAHHMYLVFD